MDDANDFTLYFTLAIHSIFTTWLSNLQYFPRQSRNERESVRGTIIISAVLMTIQLIRKLRMRDKVTKK